MVTLMLQRMPKMNRHDIGECRAQNARRRRTGRASAIKPHRTGIGAVPWPAFGDALEGPAVRDYGMCDLGEAWRVLSSTMDILRGEAEVDRPTFGSVAAPVYTRTTAIAARSRVGGQQDLPTGGHGRCRSEHHAA